MANLLRQVNLNLCSNPNDEFIEYQPHWIVTLSDGSKIYQDDDRPGEEIPSAWVRLKEWINHSRLEGSKISIIDLHLRFRSNILNPLPKNADGYFFANKIIHFVGAKEPLKFIVLGYLEDGLIKRRTIKVPELLILQDDIKTLEDKYQEFVIKRS